MTIAKKKGHQILFQRRTHMSYCSRECPHQYACFEAALIDAAKALWNESVCNLPDHKPYLFTLEFEFKEKE